MPCSVDYATLSHCWGSLKILTLRTDNLNALQESIPWDDLCKTFQDAYKVCRKLGFKYLWIDSLCIVQDDPDDWDREAFLMSKIYGGSSLNLAASMAEDGSKRLWPARNPISAPCLQVCIKDDTLRPSRQAALETNEFQSPPMASSRNRLCSGTLFNLAPKDLQYNCITKSPLAQRGWVFQERILSHKSLHFSSQLFWECRELQACEAFPTRLPTLLTRENENLQKTNNQEHWIVLITMYTACKLTFRKDKLIAIARIAQSVQKRYGNEYVAGLWRKDLETLLGGRSCEVQLHRDPIPSSILVGEDNQFSLFLPCLPLSITLSSMNKYT